MTFRYQDGLDGQVQPRRRPLAGGHPRRRAPDRSIPTPRAAVRVRPVGRETADRSGSRRRHLAGQRRPGDPILRNMFPRPTTAVEIDVVGRFAVHEPATRSGSTIAAWASRDRRHRRRPDRVRDRAVRARCLWRPAGPRPPGPLSLAGVRGRVAARRRAARRACPRPAPVRGDALDHGRRSGSGSTIARTGLLDVVERYLGQRATSEAALSIAALGPLTVAGGARRTDRLPRGPPATSPTLALARGRGASGGQLLAAQLWEGLLVAVPAALVGLAVAVALVPARASDLSRSACDPRRARGHRPCWSRPPGRPPVAPAASSSARTRRPSACRRAGSSSNRSSSACRWPPPGSFASGAWRRPASPATRRLRSVPGRLAGADRGRRRAAHDPPVPAAGPRARLADGPSPRPRPGARPAQPRPPPDGRLPAAA